ncbi:3'-5' exonuclease [Rhodobacterales bacterium HKCCE4037]|nr:3'-5' exonuclease [Rhodobacterales bacterium HKCCE4037]
MLTLLPLRLRIFLFFCLLALGGIAVAGGAIWVGAARDGGLLLPLIIFTFVNTGLILGVWLLFDENVAKPILNMAAQLRLSAHAGGGAGVNTKDARYLGDLAPAADALSQKVIEALSATDVAVATHTKRLQSEAERLTAILSEIPIATILLNPAGEIVLYDAQAAAILGAVAPPRLKARLSDYFEAEAIEAALGVLKDGGHDAALRLSDADGTHVFHGRLITLSNGGHMVLIDPPDNTGPRLAPRPLVYDFDLLDQSPDRALAETPLRDLCYVAFDTETTGLSVEKDAVIQIGAVRVLGGRIVEGESVDTYVDPGRPIPPASTRIHRITDTDVAGAPTIGPAGRTLSHFARDAVLVAHNAPFDIGLLRKSAGEMGVDWSHPVLDTVLLSAVVFGTNAQHSLDALCDRLGVTIPEDKRHTAIGDAQATAEVLVRLLPLLEGQGITTFGALVAETRKHGRLLQDMNG